jgi:hypothetical protein
VTKHSRIEFVAGDDWEIQATLLDENGNPYDLTGTHQIKWCLMDVRHQVVLGDEAIITVLDAINGLVSVVLPAAVTTNIDEGLYTDFLRLIIGQTGTLLQGLVEVTGDPWRVPASKSVAVTMAMPKNWTVRKIVA